MREHQLDFGPVPPMVYVAMFAATVAGQLAGMAIDAAVIGRRLVWFPVALSVVFEAVVGARFGASRLRRSLTSSESARLSVHYSAGLAALSFPLALWTAASTGVGAPWLGGPNSSVRAMSVSLLFVAAVFAGGAVVRQLIMVLVSPRRF